MSQTRQEEQSLSKAWFPFKRNRLHCINENRKKRKRLRLFSRNKCKRQPTGMLGRSSGNHDWLLAAFLVVYATHAMQVIVFEWKPGFSLIVKYYYVRSQSSMVTGYGDKESLTFNPACGLYGANRNSIQPKLLTVLQKKSRSTAVMSEALEQDSVM